MTLSSLTLASRTATTLSVTWSPSYPKWYSFTVSHSTQDGPIAVTKHANTDTSHTLTSLQPGTTYRFEVEVVRKGDGAEGLRAKVMSSFSTNDAGEVSAAHVQFSIHTYMCMYTKYMKALGTATCMQDTLMHSTIIHICTSMYVCVNTLLVHA